MSAETLTSAPQDEPEIETGTDTPLGMADAWQAVSDAAPRGPQTDLTRALAQLSRAQLREGSTQTAPPAIAAEWAGAVQFLADLQALLNRLDEDQARNASAVLQHLFARQQPAPNGAYRG